MKRSAAEKHATDGAQPAVRKGRPGGRSARIRRAVIDAAMRMIEERGVEGLNVAEIAGAIGVHESTIYRRWGSRDALIVETLLTSMDQTIPVPDTGNIRVDLRTFLQASADFLQSETGASLTRSAFATASQGNSPLRRAYWTARFSHTGAMIQRAIDRGELRPETDAETVLAAIIGPLYLRLLVLDQPLDDHFLDRLAATVLDGIVKKGRG